MRVLIAASDAFAGLMGRQQRFGHGLAELGHEVVYLNPPRDLHGGPAGELAGAEAHLRVIELGPCAQAGQTQTTVGAWAAWGCAVQDAVRALAAGSAGGVSRFVPDVTLVYHPALLEPIRTATPGALVFDCLDDAPGLAASRPAAEAFTAALEKGLPHADGMLAVNRYLLETWDRLLAEQAPRAVLEHGVDTSLFRPANPEQRAAARQALELASDRRLVGYLGRADERMSFEDLSTLLELDERAILLFVGEVSPAGRDIFQRLDPARVLPLGPVRPDRAAELMAGSDVLIFPFRREPQLEAVRGLKLYEYLATGLPVLATFRRGLKVFRDVLYLYATREELETGYRGAMAEPADAPARARRIEIARAADWRERIAELVAFLEPLVRTR